MNILFSAGGTLGHINPALSFIKALKNYYKDINITFIATTKEKDLEILKTNLIDNIYYIESYGISKRLLKAIYKDLRAIKDIKKILVDKKIDLAIGMGGYISGLTIYVANNLNIKTMIHEQNSIMGLANKLNLKKTNKLLLSYEDNTLKKYQNKITIIPNPRYTDASNMNKLNNKKHILITSGTNGSKFINTIMCDLLNIYDFPKYTITFITGKKYYDDVVKNIIKKPNIQILPFTNNLLNEMNLSSLVISRAGSSTLYEILGLKKLSIIIPSPNVTNNHQYYNALYFYKKDLINMIEEKDLTIEKLYNLIIETIDSKKHIYNLNKLNLKNSYTLFIDEVEKLINKGDS